MSERFASDGRRFGIIREASAQAYYFIGNNVIRLRSFGWVADIMLALVLAASGCSTTAGALGGGKAERTTSASREPLIRLQHDRPVGIDLSKEHEAPRDKVIPLEVEFAMRNK